jgi:hypothetical protein
MYNTSAAGTHLPGCNRHQQQLLQHLFHIIIPVHLLLYLRGDNSRLTVSHCCSVAKISDTVLLLTSAEL